MSRITVRGDRVLVQLEPEAVQVLEGMPDWLADVGLDPRDPAGPRLSQSAYPDDPMASAEYEIVAGDNINDLRVEDRSTFLRTLTESGDDIELTVEQAEAWMRVVGDTRLMLASRLGYTENDQLNQEPTSPSQHLLYFLTFVQTALIDAIDQLLFD